VIHDAADSLNLRDMPEVRAGRAQVLTAAREILGQ